ncbi:MAG: tRNA lysidine(34) synthetase TilS [Cyclonatronaceae bacterium]
MTSASTLLSELRGELSQLPPARVLAVSGGLDSMLLLSLHLLHPGPVYVVHVNYGKRGAASDADEALIAECCRINGLPFFCFFYDDEARRGSKNFQQQARRFRYTKLENVRKAAGADIILTAHHADDERETLLFQTLRSGAIGDISGISYREKTLARPFLKYPKARLRKLAEAIGLPWREDASNATADYTRNALRNRLIPLLDTYVPQWAGSLEQLSESGKAFHQAVEQLLETVSKPAPARLLMREKWLAQPEPLRTALLHAWIGRQSAIRGPSLSRAALQQLGRSLPGLQSGRFAEAGALQIWREGAFFRAVPAGSLPAQSREITLYQADLPLRRIIPTASGTHSIRLEARRSTWAGRPKTPIEDALDLELRFHSLAFPLQLRPWRAGDRIRPLGMSGHQNVSDVLTNKKVRPIYRNAALLLCGRDGRALALVWAAPAAPGGILAAEAACGQKDAPTLWLRFQLS